MNLDLTALRDAIAALEKSLGYFLLNELERRNRAED